MAPEGREAVTGDVGADPLVNWQVWFNKTASRIRVGAERANATMKTGMGWRRFAISAGIGQKMSG